VIRPRRRLRRAARSLPDPPTALMPPVPAVPEYRPRHRRRCPGCGRPTGGDVWCCWVCRFAADGGWQLGRWSARAPWHDVHTEPCERAARALDPRWYAGSAARRV